MKDYLCDFTDELNEISNVLKYRFSYSADEVIETSVFCAEKKTNDYGNRFIIAVREMVSSLLQHEILSNDRGREYRYSLMYNNFNPESIIGKIGRKYCTAYEGVKNVIHAYVDRVVPNTYNDKARFEEEILNSTLIGCEDIPGDNDKYKIEDVLNCAFELIMENAEHYIDIENYNHDASKKEVPEDSEDVTSDVQTNDACHDNYLSAIAETESGFEFMSYDMTDLIKEIELNSYVIPLILNYLQLKMCEKYNMNERYTQYHLNEEYDIRTVKNGLYRGYSNTFIKELLMSMCNENTTNYGREGRWCYKPFYSIDYVALNTTLFTKYSIDKVTAHFENSVLGGEEGINALVDSIKRNCEGADSVYVEDSLSKFIKNV